MKDQGQPARCCSQAHTIIGHGYKSSGNCRTLGPPTDKLVFWIGVNFQFPNDAVWVPISYTYCNSWDIFFSMGNRISARTVARNQNTVSYDTGQGHRMCTGWHGRRYRIYSVVISGHFMGPVPIQHCQESWWLRLVANSCLESQLNDWGDLTWPLDSGWTLIVSPRPEASWWALKQCLVFLQST